MLWQNGLFYSPQSPETKPVKFTFGSHADHNIIFQALYLSREWFSNAQNSKRLFYTDQYGIGEIYVTKWKLVLVKFM